MPFVLVTVSLFHVGIPDPGIDHTLISVVIPYLFHVYIVLGHGKHHYSTIVFAPLDSCGFMEEHACRHGDSSTVNGYLNVRIAISRRVLECRY